MSFALCIKSKKAGTQGHLHTVGDGTQKQLEKLDLPSLASTTACNCQSFRGEGSLFCFPKPLGLMTKNSAFCVQQ